MRGRSGVGTERSAIAIRLGRSYLWGRITVFFPISWRGKKKEKSKFIKLRTKLLFISSRVILFTAVDIFAPVSAHLAQGTAISDLGPRLEKIEQLNLPRANYQKREAKGEIQFIDRFGNAITNIVQMKLEPNFQSDKIILTVGNKILPL